MLVFARSMLAAGHEVRFFFSRTGARLAEFEACATTHVGGPAELVGVCETWEPHIVHAPMQAFEAEVAIFASVPPRLVISSHGMVADRWHTGNCAVATAVSKHWASRFSQASGLPTETIYNEIDWDRFTPTTEAGDVTVARRAIIGWVGRTSSRAYKDFPRFLSIAERFPADRFELWVVDGSGEPDLPTTHLPFRHIQRVPYAEMPNIYRAIQQSAGVILSTSRSEGFPLVALEAPACGVPVIAPMVAGFSEAILPSRTGLLFDSGAAAEDVATRVTEFVESGYDSHACAAAVRSEFGNGQMTRAYLSAYYGALDSHGIHGKTPFSVGEALAGDAKWRCSMGRHSAGWACELARSGMIRPALAAHRRS